MKSKFIIPAPTSDSYLSTSLMLGQLPSLLERAMLVADQPAQMDMLLLSTLTVCSYALPHIKMLHGNPQHTYYPNLMTLIVAPPASGKGVMNNARLLLKPIQNHLRKQNKFAEIPANSSSAAFLDLLKASDGQGFVMATEMDNLSKIWKQDYGDYSDLFRQAFEHESYSKARRSGMRKSSLYTFDEPKLSVLLSGTPNQLRPLIGTGEDGLASRFLPYFLQDVMPFDRNALMNGDHYTDNGAKAVFDELGKELYYRWLWLSAQDSDTLWSLTDEQAEALADFLEDWESIVRERPQNSAENTLPDLPDAFRAMFNRLPVTLKRIGLILTALRLDIPASLPEAKKPLSRSAKSGLKSIMDKVLGREEQTTSSNVIGKEISRFTNSSLSNCPKVLYCSDDDFKTLVILAEKFIRHLLDLALMLPEPKTPLHVNQLQRPAQPRAQELLDLLPDKFTTKEAITVGSTIGMEKRTVEEHLTNACADKTIVRISRGTYQKV